ncbi:MAG: sensor domain-containing diguanylate cyclase [Actinobacteria bacterium]|nr:sensor domain-containing diguanylate cyclase [Actinomycetota bacterium]
MKIRNSDHSPASAQEIASLAERMGYLQALRATFAVAVIGSTIAASDIVGASLTDLVFLSAAYLVPSVVLETARRRVGRRGIVVVEGMLLVDAVYLALVAYATGGIQSPLRFLVYLHIIAVTLLTSYRTGMKIAIWHALLFFVTFYAQASGILPPLEATGAGVSSGRPSFFNVVPLLLVAAGTMAFSSVNERELRRRKSDLEALTSTAGKLEDASEPTAVAQIVLDGALEALSLPRALLIASRPGQPPELLAYRGELSPPTDLPATVDSVVQKAWDAHAPALVRKLDPIEDAYLAALIPDGQNIAVVPLFAEGQPIGAMVIEHSGRSQRIERRVLATLGQFAAHASLALRNVWLLEEIQKIAATDGLTGIANRRTFEDVLEREISRARRNGEPVTLVMLDIDHFKKLNDTHGHQTGDDVLRGAGAALAAQCRDFDTPARYGGEEFAIILPACSPRESLVAGDRLRTAVGNADVPVKITASAGVATFPTHASDPQGLIKAADEALYESKRSGRDRVTRSRRSPAPDGIFTSTD